MSLARHVSQLGMYRFPRVSGDEPRLQGQVATPGLFSPRERG